MRIRKKRHFTAALQSRQYNDFLQVNLIIGRGAVGEHFRRCKAVHTMHQRTFDVLYMRQPASITKMMKVTWGQKFHKSSKIDVQKAMSSGTALCTAVF